MRARVFDVAGKKIIFESCLPRITSAVDGKLSAMIQNIMNRLKPKIR
jgi:hypothetical protein